MVIELHFLCDSRTIYNLGKLRRMCGMCRSVSELKSLEQLNLAKNTIEILSTLDLSLEKMVSLARWVDMYGGWDSACFWVSTQVWNLLSDSAAIKIFLKNNGDTRENREKAWSFFCLDHGEGRKAVIQFCEAVKKESFINDSLFDIFRSVPFSSVQVLNYSNGKHIIIGPYSEPYNFNGFCSMEEKQYIYARGFGPQETNELLGILQYNLSPAQYQMAKFDILLREGMYVIANDVEGLLDDGYYLLTREEMYLLRAARKNSRMLLYPLIDRIILPN